MNNSLVRLQDVPVFAMYWYFFTHQELWCSTFIVLRYEYTFFPTPVKIRNVRASGEWRGIYGS